MIWQANGTTTLEFHDPEFQEPEEVSWTPPPIEDLDYFPEGEPWGWFRRLIGGRGSNG